MENLYDSLPGEVEEMLRLQREEKLAKIEAFGTALACKRQDAVDGRKSSGIEQEWWESEEQYQGIDDANRGEGHGALKPNSLGGSFIAQVERKDSRSTVFLNITRPYVDAAAAKVSDMLLPTDDRNWGIKPTPIPSLTQALKDNRPAMSPQQQGAVQQLAGPGQFMGQDPMQAPQGMPQPMPPGPQGQSPQGAMPPGPPQGQPPAPPPPQPTIADLAKQEIAEATQRAEAAEKRIEDWLIECQYHAEVRKVIEDCARLGVGILKGPFPEKRTRRAVIQAEGGMGMSMSVEYAPSAKRIDPWNFYPDPACGEDMLKGSYVWEKDELTARQVKELIGVPGYLDDQIKKVLEEGPGKKFENARNVNQRTSVSEKEKYEIWYYHGMVDAEDLKVVGVDVEEDTGGAFAIVTMINDTPIKAALQPLETERFPYQMMPWQRKTNSVWGSGVARLIRTPQRIVNAGSRNLMDNAGVSAGGQFVMRRGSVEPADGSWAITPRKIWFVTDDSVRVNDVFASVQLPSMQAELMNIIQFAMKMAEDVTGLPQLLQGMQGKAPETVGGMTMLMNNASSVLRRIARTFDDCITEPFIRSMYEWLMEYGENDDEKGDFTIDARGSTALVERDLSNQAILGMAQFVMNPAFEISPARWIREAMRAQKLDPKRIELDDEEKQKLAQQQQPPPPPPQIEAAKIRADVEMKKTQMLLEAKAQESQMENQTDQMRIQSDTDRDLTYVQAETQRTQSEHQARMAELQVKRELEMLKYANANRISLDQIKADLAKETMRLTTQKELAAASNAIKVPQVATPAFEPPGRAQPGKAFQQ